MQLDNDGLFLGGGAFKEVHKYLQLPIDVHRVMDQDLIVCEQWHEKCSVVVVPSQKIVRAASKLVQWLPTCSCMQVLLQKGIIVGRKIGIKVAILENKISYLQCFWSTIGIMTTENSKLFQTSIQGFSFWMRHGKEFCVGD
jgi:phosphoribosylformylglycinamidine (FGAM) synthase-like amidotransferase family enzyme